MDKPVLKEQIGDAHLEPTQRHLEVLLLVKEGYTNRQIGIALGIEDNTVKQHICEVIYRLGATDRTSAVIRAIKRGLITL